MDEADPPYSSYAAIAATFLGGLTGAAALARAQGRDLRDLTALDLVTLAGATFKASRTISRDRVGTFLREPFVEGEPGHGHEEPAGEGLRRAIGELVTCTRCVGAWSALGLVGLRIAAPTAGRTVTDVFAVAALNDFLQAGFRALCEEVNARSSAR
jgi:hypothetical protein